MNSKKIVRIGGMGFAITLLPIGGYVLGTIANGNFHEVAKGQAYRSAQINGTKLSSVISEHNIKSILNLRGANPETNWYRDEIAICNKLAVNHFDLSISSGRDLSVQETKELVSILRDAPKPLLIHCRDGADRSGLGSAIYHLAVEGKTSSEAQRELTIWYGHIPLVLRKTQAMDRSFWRYAESLPQNSNPQGIQRLPAF